MARSSIYSKAEFFSRMKKKPALQAIIDNLGSYTEDDLANVPGQPLWIRNELVDLKRRDGKTIEQFAEETADRMVVNTPTAEPLHEVRQWVGNPTFLRTGGKLEIEVNPGELLLLMPAFLEARVDHVAVKLNPTQWQNMLASSSPVGYMTATDYRIEVRNRLNRKH